MKGLALAVVFLLSLATALTEDKASSFENPTEITTDTRLYGSLAGEADVYGFSTTGETLRVFVSVPAQTPYRNFAPTVVLIGKGLPPSDLYRVPSGTGAVPFDYEWNGKTFFEPFSLYQTRQSFEYQLPAGEYYLEILGGTGKYVVRINDAPLASEGLLFAPQFVVAVVLILFVGFVLQKRFKRSGKG